MITQSNNPMSANAEPNRPITVVDERIRKMIAGAVAEIDLAQIAILRKLTPADRFAQMLSMIRFTETTAATRLRQRNPSLSIEAALRIVRSGSMTQWLAKHPPEKATVSG